MTQSMVIKRCCLTAEVV